MHIAIIVLLSVLAALLLLFALALFAIAPSRRRAARGFAAVRYAHRGLHGSGIAENSLSAFRAAAEAGYGIELDVRLSRDGELVVFHDDTLERVTEATGRVDSLTAKELSALRLSGTDDTVPSFREVLDLVGGRVPLLIELKEDAGKYCVTEKALDILKGYAGDYMIESFNPLALARVKKLAPDVTRGFLSQNFFKEKKYRAPTYFLLQHLLLNFLCRPDFIAFCHRDTKMPAFRLIRRLFKATSFAWTTESEADDAAALGAGFSSVIFQGYLPEVRIASSGGVQNERSDETL